MRPRKYYVFPGQKYGDWTVLKVYTNSTALCECACGIQETVKVHLLVKGGHLCQRSHKVGQHFGHVTVVGQRGNRDRYGNLIYESLCACGASTSLNLSQLRTREKYNIGCGEESCPYFTCSSKFVRGVRVSLPQIRLAEMLGIDTEHINYKVVVEPRKRYYVDMVYPKDKIGIEYDGFFYHDEEKDALRVQKLNEKGWRILAVKGNTLLPTIEEMYTYIEKLKRGSWYEEIMLLDWKECVDKQTTE